MSVAAAYGLGPIQLNGTTISGIERSAASNGVTFTNPTDTGNQYPTFSALVGLKQGGVFSSRDIAGVLGKTGVGGVAISSTTAQFFKKRAAVGPAASGHRSYTHTNGAIIPVSLSCNHQGNCVISGAIVPSSPDGITSGIALNNAATLPTEVTASLDDVWTLYRANFGGTVFTSWTQVNLDFGNTLRTVGSNSEILDSAFGVISSAPSVTVTGLDLSLWTTSGIQAGIACTHADSYLRFFKRNVSTGTAEHIQLTLNGIAACENIVDSSGDGESTTGMRWVGNATTAGTPPLVYSLIDLLS